MTLDPVEWRKQRGISLAAIAASTKISSRYLEAIEGGRFQSLPGGVYALSYIRQYAQAIQFEESTLLERYRRVVRTDG
ncbi:MAG TPA: helix-turn-helix domain-containing protein [Candidatus Sulfopaludibacter sp.]|jgi:cytoskeletal protein RodZ|nr:helix-turn-helix domain-containing protein [Candidatus Sulfopaludibacter sp.]